MGWEADILLYIQEYIRSDFFNPVMTVFTHTGDYGIFVMVLAAVLLILPRTRKTGIIAATSIALEALLTNVLIKNLVARTRPYDAIEGLENLIEKQKDFSFPSGHTGSAFAVMGAIFLVAVLGLPAIAKTGEFKRIKTSRTFKIWAVIAIVYAVILGFSRLYVGVHYPTDVIGGLLLGVATSFIAYFLFRAGLKIYFNKKAKKEAESNTQDT